MGSASDRARFCIMIGTPSRSAASCTRREERCSPGASLTLTLWLWGALSTNVSFASRGLSARALPLDREKACQHLKAGLNFIAAWISTTESSSRSKTASTSRTRSRGSGSEESGLRTSGSGGGLRAVRARGDGE